jgi:redox-sensitive bicupin YhaK (pirin superfamily)
MNATVELPTRAESATRRIVQTTSGRRQGPITRLVSPSDVGELIKPFVFLDHFEVAPRPEPFMGIHPHSGIATLTVVLRGGVVYEDTTGKAGTVPMGGLEWMKAGNGVWHDGGAALGEPLRGFQLWVALPPSEENGPAESQYIAPEQVQQEGPARVVLGSYGRAVSPIRAPAGITYLHVRLKGGQRWRYTPQHGHTVAWLAVDAGRLQSSVSILAGSRGARRHIVRSRLGDQAPVPARPRLLLSAYEPRGAHSGRNGNQSDRPAASRRRSSLTPGRGHEYAATNPACHRRYAHQAGVRFLPR